MVLHGIDARTFAMCQECLFTGWPSESYTCSSTVAEWRVLATTATAPGSTGHVTWTICLCRRRVASRRPSDAPPRRQSMNLADSVNSTPFYSLSPATSLLSQRSRPGYRTPLTDQLVRYMAAVLAVLFIFPDSVFFLSLYCYFIIALLQFYIWTNQTYNADI